MKSILCFLAGVVLAVTASRGIAEAGRATHPFQLVSQETFLTAWPVDAQVTYVQGMSDALTFVTSRNAIGAGLSRCYADGNVKSAILLHLLLMEDLETADRTEPIPSVMLKKLIAECGELLD